MRSETSLRYFPRFATAVAVISKVDAVGNSPRSLAKTFSRSRDYSVSTRFDINDFSIRASDLASYSTFFSRLRAPYYTPFRSSYYSNSKKHFLSKFYKTQSLFGWGQADDFFFSRVKPTRKGVLVFARSYGSSAFAYFFRKRYLHRRFTEKTKRGMKRFGKRFRPYTSLYKHPYRLLLKQFKPFLRSFRFKTWYARFFSQTAKFQGLKLRSRFHKFVFHKLIRARTFSLSKHRSLKKKHSGTFEISPVSGAFFLNFIQSLRKLVFFKRVASSFGLKKVFKKKSIKAAVSRKHGYGRFSASFFTSAGNLPSAHFGVSSAHKFFFSRSFFFSATSVSSAFFFGANNFALVGSCVKFYRLPAFLNPSSFVAPLQKAKFFAFFRCFNVPQVAFDYYFKQLRLANASSIFGFYNEVKKLFKLFLKVSAIPKKTLQKRLVLSSPESIAQDLVIKKTVFKLARNLSLRSYYKTRFILPFLFLFDRQFSHLSQPLPYFFNFRPYSLSYVHTTTGRFNRPTNRFSTLPVR